MKSRLDAMPLFLLSTLFWPICMIHFNFSFQDKNPSSFYGDTPLHLATENNHLEVCRLLINSIEDKNPKIRISSWTPLHLAAQKGRYFFTALLFPSIPFHFLSFHSKIEEWKEIVILKLLFPSTFISILKIAISFHFYCYFLPFRNKRSGRK